MGAMLVDLAPASPVAPRAPEPFTPALWASWTGRAFLRLVGAPSWPGSRCAGISWFLAMTGGA